MPPFVDEFSLVFLISLSTSLPPPALLHRCFRETNPPGVRGQLGCIRCSEKKKRQPRSLIKFHFGCQQGCNLWVVQILGMLAQKLKCLVSQCLVVCGKQSKNRMQLQDSLKSWLEILPLGHDVMVDCNIGGMSKRNCEHALAHYVFTQPSPKRKLFKTSGRKPITGLIKPPSPICTFILYTLYTCLINPKHDADC